MQAFELLIFFICNQNNEINVGMGNEWEILLDGCARFQEEMDSRQRSRLAKVFVVFMNSFLAICIHY
jgi:hypothetical protein